MLIDSRTIPNQTEILTDVCIVGAGTAGITLAHEFVDQGFTVALLESGGRKPDRESHALNAGENVGRPYFALASSRARFLGGCCNRWLLKLGDGGLGARVRPLDPIDFEKKSWVPHSGWPFNKKHLDPYYDRAQQICRVDPISYAPEDWVDTEGRKPFEFHDRRLQTVMFKFCAKDPFLRIYLERIIGAANIKTYLYANVVDIETDENARTASGVKVSCLHGPTFHVKARIVILALGGLETPRLLLLSNRVQREGLGNQNEVVGRYFMEHPHFRLGYIVPFDPAVIARTAFYNQVHQVNQVPVVGKIALTEATIRKEKLLNFVTQLNPRVMLTSMLAAAMYPKVASKGVKSFKILRGLLSERKVPPDIGRHVFDMVKGIDDICVSAVHKIRRDVMHHFSKHSVHAYWLENMSEQSPNPDSRVVLTDQLDQLGQRRIALNWQLADIDIQSAVRSQRIMDAALGASGFGRLYSELNAFTAPEKITGGWHQMGTTRMHEDPRYGVVDTDSRVHGLSNLYIAGPGVFPTTGYANPILTIVAMTVRLADHIRERLKR